MPMMKKQTKKKRKKEKKKKRKKERVVMQARQFALSCVVIFLAASPRGDLCGRPGPFLFTGVALGVGAGSDRMGACGARTGKGESMCRRY